ncbi:MAG TPA: M20/M25/M40 family metallo-hydrolase [Bryobacteraceae bacterium]|nr:M20/M25/M40 family metallo-hydrolase [Bryobacteraceae bacterium]
MPEATSCHNAGMSKFSVLLLLGSLSLPAASLLPPEPDQHLAREIYAEMIESKSGFTTGATTPIAESVAARLKAAAFPESDIFVGGAIPTKYNLVVRYHGSGTQKPILLLAHIDVVEARREDWSMDPFQLIEKDGYFYGRGTSDDKAQAAIWVANLIRYKREGFRPDRDLIVALTADEEGGGPYNGVDWLLRNHRDLIESDFALNEGGKGEMINGKRIANEIGLAEKTYADFRFEVHNKGGHSSRPVPDNAIYHLAGALSRLAAYNFPFQLNDVTRAYFAQLSKIETGPLAADLAQVAHGDEKAMERVAKQSPGMNSMLRTTCVATQLEGGHAPNALPQLAAANINCRIFPDDTVEHVLAALKQIAADDQVIVSIKTAEAKAPPSPMRPDIMNAFAQITDTMWPGVIAVPEMSTGASDGRYLRAAGIPTYGIQGFFLDRDDVRAHGRDERMPVQSFYEGQTFLYELVKRLSSEPMAH